MAAFASTAFSTSAFSVNAFDFGGTPPVPDAVKTGTGGIDPGEGLKRQRVPVKPTGLIDRPRRVIEGRKDVEDRVDESRQIQAEIAGKLAREFGEETQQIAEQLEIAELTAAQVDAEIRMLLHKKLRTEEEELILLMLMAAAS